MATVFAYTDDFKLTFSIEPAVQEIIAKRKEDMGFVDKPSCKYFQKGTCMKGDQCPYRHAKSEKSVVCKHWLRGLCKKNDECEFLHEYDLSKMPPCHFYLTYGQCSNLECLFLHQNPEEQKKDCPWYKRGFCKHGPNCRNRHVREIACPDYLAGFCIAGPNCDKGHPKYELPEEHSGPGGRPRAPLPCSNCGNPGHATHQCPEVPESAPSEPPKPGLRALNEVQCFKCSEIGHYANKCPNKRRAPPQGGYSLPGRPDIRVNDPRSKPYNPRALQTED